MNNYYMTLTTTFFLYSCPPCFVEATPIPLTYELSISSKYVEAAIHTRPKNLLDALNGLAARDDEIQVGKQLWYATKDCTRGGDLVASIQNFLEIECGVAFPLVERIIPHKTTTREPVYIDHAAEIVIKVIPSKKIYEVIREISGQDAFKNLGVGVVDYLAVGKCTLDGTDYMFLAQRKAPGHVIVKYIDAIFTSPNRSAALKVCKNALYTLGQLLYKIHSQTALNAEVTQEYRDNFLITQKDKIARHLETLRKFEIPEVQQLEQLFISLLKQYAKEPIYFALYHGDSHLENFLHDVESDRTIPIDLTRVHLYVDENNTPISPFYLDDLGRVHDDITKWVLKHALDEDLIQELQAAVLEGYNSEGNSLFSPTHYLFNKAFYLLTCMKSNLNWKNEKDTGKKIEMQRMHTYAKQKLLNIYKNG